MACTSIFGGAAQRPNFLDRDFSYLIQPSCSLYPNPEPKNVSHDQAIQTSPAGHYRCQTNYSQGMEKPLTLALRNPIIELLQP